MKDSLKNKTFLVTGANSGIGRVTAEELASRGAHVILACRSKERTQPVLDAIIGKHGDDSVTFLPLDLSSFESIKAATQEFLELNTSLDGLILNAGLAGAKGLTKEGFEITFGVNHLGHFLFTLPLVEKLKASAPSRVVVVSSVGHYRAKDGIDFSKLKSPRTNATGLPEYFVSKLANVLFASELARKLEGTGVTTYSLHPGEVASDIWRGLPKPLAWLAKKFMQTNEQGAMTTLHCATDLGLANETGHYYNKDQKRKTPSRFARDKELAKELWDRSLEWTGLSDI